MSRHFTMDTYHSPCWGLIPKWTGADTNGQFYLHNQIQIKNKKHTQEQNGILITNI